MHHIYAGISKWSQRGGLENRLPKRHGGSNPSSCANKNGLLLAGRPIFIATVRGSRIRSPSELARRGVRIPHPKIEELALQAQGVGIFVKDEYPSSKPFDKLEFVLLSNQFEFKGLCT